MQKTIDSHAQAWKERQVLKNLWGYKEIIKIYESKRSNMLWLLTVFIFMVLIVTIYFTLTMSGEEFSSELSAGFWKGFFILMPAILFYCMLWLNGKYVLKLEVLPNKVIRISTWSIFKMKRKMLWKAEDFDPHAQFYEGRTEIIGKPKVYAPFLIFKSRKGKKLLLDLQGEMPYGILILIRLLQDEPSVPVSC